MLPRSSSAPRPTGIALGTLFSLLLFAVWGAGTALGQEQAAVGDRVQVKLTPTGKAQFVGEDGALPTSVSNARTGVSALDQVAQTHGVTQMERVFRPAGKHEPRHVEWGLDRWYTVQYQSDAAPETVARDYLDVPQVAAASPVYEKKMTEIRTSPPDEEPSYVPDDPEYDQQWHYNNTGQTGGTPDADIDLPEAHNITTGTPNVVISIVDSGLDLDHPDFQGMLWINEAEDINGNGQFDATPASEGGDLDGVDNDNNGFVDDVVGYNHADDDPVPSASGDHGTHVTGTVAAKNDNGEFVAGVAGGGPNGSGVRLMINQTFGASVGGFPEAITYAADNGAIVSQNSWGNTSEGTFEQAVLDAIDYFRANAGGANAPMDGGLFVNAAGNNDSNGEWYPGFYGPSTAVTSTNDTDSKSVFSNYGSWVDIAAPGSNVLSTVVGGSGTLSGTSMAAPHVSGVIGLVASANPGLTDDQMETLLINTGDDISDNQPEIMGPRVNAFNALSSGGVDETPPGAIADLSVLYPPVNQYTPGASATLEWTAPGDDGDTTGTASTYDLRYSTNGPIDDSTSWADATPLEGLPLPDTVGTVQSVTISNGLPFGETVHFGLRASDEFGNTSALGNSPSADTPPAPALAYSPDSLSAELETGNDTSLTLSLSNEGPAETSLQYSFPDFAAQALLNQVGTERNNTSSVIGDAGYEKGNDPHAGIGHPVLTGAGGPDEYGYSWIDSNEPGGPSFAFNDISDVGTPLDISDDFGASPSPEVDLPFEFEFYGEAKTAVRVDNNGFLHFDSPSGNYFENAEIPAADPPNGVLAPFWDDLDPTTGTVYTYHDEGAGQFIVQYDEVEAFFNNVPMTFQVVLSQDGTIRYNLLDIDENDNSSATLGIETTACRWRSTRRTRRTACRSPLRRRRTSSRT